MKTKITTDWHLAVKRVGGTTPHSQGQLRQYLRDMLTSQLDNTDHLIAGDLFDDFTVDTVELVEVLKIFSTWLTGYGRNLALIRGNHDHSERGSSISSFDLLGYVLKTQFPSQVTIADRVTKWKQFTLVPHLPNNETLLKEVTLLSDTKNRVLVFHANVDNFHTAESQHSLNLSMEQIEDLTARGNLVIVGHEHQYRSLVNGKCLVLGNTAPSSIADCLRSPFKYAALVTDTEYELKPSWKAVDSYIEVDWRDMPDLDGHQFIRVVGEATALEAADVIKTVSKLRQKSEAFVITNSVRIEGRDLSDNTDSIESIKAFDLMGAILSELSEQEQETLKELLK